MTSRASHARAQDGLHREDTQRIRAGRRCIWQAKCDLMVVSSASHANARVSGGVRQESPGPVSN
jgi:hypothetical protein